MCGPDMGCFMPLQTIAWLRFSRWRMFWGSLNVWVPNGFGFWKITNSLPLKIVLLQMFHAGLPSVCVSNAEHVPWRSQHGASVEFPLEIIIIADCTWQWGVRRSFGWLMELEKKLKKEETKIMPCFFICLKKFPWYNVFIRLAGRPLCADSRKAWTLWKKRFFFLLFIFLKLVQIEFRRDKLKLNIRKCFLMSWCNRAEEPLMSVIEMLLV